MNLRKTVSLTTLLSFIILLITSIVLYITPQGKVAFWANWKMLGLDKEQWGALHTNIGILFIAAGIVHTVLNWKPIVAYMKKAQKLRVFTPDFSLALIITLAVTLLTLWELPPINLIQHRAEAIKSAAAQKYGDPPYGHAESSTLETFCRRTGLDLEQALKNLNAAGLQNISAVATLAEMSDANKIPPQKLYSLMRPAAESASGTKTGGGAGFGRKTLSMVCSENGLDCDQILKTLSEKGITASPDQSIRDIANAAGVESSDLKQILLPTPETH